MHQKLLSSIGHCDRQVCQPNKIKEKKKLGQLFFFQLKMARSGSPGFGNGYEEDPIFQKSHYTQDISEQMRVPKRIRATGEYYDDLDHFPYSNGGSNHWNYQDKIDMTVPDRIVVMGQDQHLGV